jgi:hypothetical protein
VADEKTRVLTADEIARLGEDAARPAVQSRPVRKTASPKPVTEAPRVVGDKIVFFCPNGHKIVVDRAWAGRRGTCSKAGCNAPVMIPALPGAGPPVEPIGPPADERPEEPQNGEASGSDGGAGAAQTPATLALDTGGAADRAAETPASADQPAVGWDIAGAPASSAADAPADVGFDPGGEVAGWSIDIDEIENPTARLVARLWLERAHGGIVEVHLSGGSVIMPEWYEPRWSGGAHALFAAQAADGTITLTAVAWDQIQKVVVRQVQGTPDGMFEG